MANLPKPRIPSVSRLLAQLKGDNRIPVLVGLVCLSLLLAWPNFVPRQKGIPHIDISSFEGAVLAADYAARQNNLTAEAFYYAKAHRLNPEDLRILDRLLTVRLLLGEVDATVRLAKKLVAMNPHHTYARLVLAAAAVKNNDGVQAIQQAGMIIADDSARLTASMVTLWAGQMSNDDGIIIPALVELENETVLTGPALRAVALFYEFSGDTTRAEEVYETVIKAHGLMRVDHALDYLFFLHRAGKEDQRNSFFKNISGYHDGHAVYRHITPVLEQSPEPLNVSAAEALARGFYDVAEFHHQQKTSREKLVYVRIANWMAPSRRGIMAIADALAEMSLYAEAIAAYETIHDDTIFGETVRASIALLHEADDAPDMAVALLEQEVIADDSRFTVKLIADMLRRQGKYNEAEVYYSSIIDRLDTAEKRDWDLFYGRGIVRERLGNWPAAEADLLRAKDLSGGRPYVLNYLGYSWIDNGKNVEQGLAMVEQAVQAEPNNGYFVDSLGWAFYRLGDFQKAVRFLEYATMLQPGDPEIIDHLGDALWQVGRKFEARYQWQRVLTLEISEEKRERIERKIDFGVFEDHQGQKLAI